MRSKCLISKEQAVKLYAVEKRTLEEMCPLIGVKSVITARKHLNKMGISTNFNEKVSLTTRQGKTHEEFKKFLEEEYLIKLQSLRSIAKKLNVTPEALRRYFVKYQIPLRENKVAKSVATKGERSVK